MAQLKICSQCGTLFEAKAWQVKYGRDKTCPVCTPPDPRHSKEYRDARKLAVARAHGHCEHPGCRSRYRLQCDHIDGDASNHDLANLRMLCLPHHQQKTARQLATKRAAGAPPTDRSPRQYVARRPSRYRRSSRLT